MVLKRVRGAVQSLENAKKNRSIRIDTMTPYWPFGDIVELGKWCLTISKHESHQLPQRRCTQTILERTSVKILFFSTSSVVALTSCLCASVVAPISYQVSQQLAGGPYFYPDNGFRLTDGIEGLLLDAVEPADRGWDGWWNPNPATEFIAPTINLNLGSIVSVTRVTINVLRWDEAAVYLPKQVKIQNQLFSVDSEALLNLSAGWLVFDGSWDTATLNVSIEDFWKRGFNPGNPPPTGGWSFIGEVAISGVPEPSALSLFVVGLGALALVRRRRS